MKKKEILNNDNILFIFPLAFDVYKMPPLLSSISQSRATALIDSELQSQLAGSFDFFTSHDKWDKPVITKQASFATKETPGR